MKIYVYWNRNDNDCTKIFHFMSENDEYSIVERLRQEGSLFLQKVDQSFHNRFEYSIVDCLGQKSNLLIQRVYQPFHDRSEVVKKCRSMI